MSADWLDDSGGYDSTILHWTLVAFRWLGRFGIGAILILSAVQLARFAIVDGFMSQQINIGSRELNVDWHFSGARAVVAGVFVLVAACNILWIAQRILRGKSLYDPDPMRVHVQHRH